MVMDLLTDALRQAIFDHAMREAPRECCGLLVRWAENGVVSYYAGQNMFAGAAGQDHFELDPDAWRHCEDLGEVLAVVHSHPNASANPSMADRVGCERSGVPWLVMGTPHGVVKEISPDGWQAPLVGREFSHGVLDCYTLLQDWYFRQLGIELPYFERQDGWWEDKPGQPAQDLYVQNFASAGFVQVQGQPQLDDVILMNVRSNKANHAAIYIGHGRLLHHLHGRPSCEDVYGGYWQRHTVALLRHASKVKA